MFTIEQVSNLCLKCREKKCETECIKLKCNHLFCMVCVNDYLKVECLKGPKIKCPQGNCDTYFRDAQIRKVLSDEDIVLYESSCLKLVLKTHKCILDECLAYYTYTDIDVQYECESCSLYNCISCKAAHLFKTCEQYKEMSDLEKFEFCKPGIERAKQRLRNKIADSKRDMLKSLEEQDLIANDKVIECVICSYLICKGEGVKLRNCTHNICKTCLCDHIKSTTIPVKCPTQTCSSDITDQEIQGILSHTELLKYLEKCVNFAKHNLPNCLYCKGINCDYFCIYSKKPDEFTCPKCHQINCVKCNTVHLNENCETYQSNLKLNPGHQKTEEDIKKGLLMRCPVCLTLLQKKKGCNFIQCTRCFLEICWLRKMARWGPKGRGDTTGGCQCLVDGVNYCHPNCLGCMPDNFVNTRAFEQDIRESFAIGNRRIRHANVPMSSLFQSMEAQLQNAAVRQHRNRRLPRNIFRLE